jgi:hypothetical protein
MLLRRFVTAGQAWVLDSGRLSNRAFNIVIGQYHQFVGMQYFLWWVATGKKIFPFALDVASQNSMSFIDFASDSRLVVDVLQYVCIMSRLNTGLDLRLQVHNPQASTQTSAHAWLTTNWNKVRNMTTKNTLLPTDPPNRHDTEKWTTCMKRLFKAQLGVGIQKAGKKADSGYTINPGSMWKTLGIDLQAYTVWMLGTEATKVALCPEVQTICDLCGPNSGIVRCVHQGRLAVCNSRRYLIRVYTDNICYRWT